MKRIFWFALVTTVLIVSLAVPRSVLSQETTYPTTITDLGTGDYSAAADVNESGQVVGWYYPHDYESNHGFFWTESGGTIDLGLGTAYGINDLGQVVGFRNNSDNSNFNAFLWTEDNGIVDIYAGDSVAYDINNLGQVTGCYGWGDGAFIWSVETGMRNMNIETGQPLTCAFGINENGQIIGDSSTGPFIWTPGIGIQFLTNSSADHAYSINDAGQVAVISNGSIFIWSTVGGLNDISVPSESFTFINELGQVSGSTYYDSASHGFLWSQETGLIILPHLAPDIEFPASYAARSNTVGQIVGSSCGSTYCGAVLWTVELPPPTPQKQIEKIDAKVDALVSAGTLNKGEGTALISKLDSATNKINKGNNKAARNVLGAFINTVEAFVNSGRLTAIQAQPLIDSTNIVINNLP